MTIYGSVFSVLAAASILFVTLGFPRLASGENAQTYNEQFPITYTVTNICSENTDETIQLNGTLHVNSTSVADQHGGFHITSHANWQDVEGTNLTTGETYRFITRGKSTFNTNGELPFTSTMTTHNNLVGQGTGAILIMQIEYHVTVNANGEVTSQFSHQSAECKD